VVLRGGRQAGLKALAEQRAVIDEQLPATMRTLVDGQLQTLEQIGQRIEQLEREIAALQKQLKGARELDRVPGIGVLGCTALAATLGDGKAWRSGREFSASLGLVPAHAGTGGKVRVGHLSKRGDPYLRTLLIHGARSVIEHAKDKPKWLQDLLARRPLNVAVVALANKMARTAWAIVAHGRTYQRDWKSTRPGSKSEPAQAVMAKRSDRGPGKAGSCAGASLMQTPRQEMSTGLANDHQGQRPACPGCTSRPDVRPQSYPPSQNFKNSLATREVSM
jgi:hypothetical protein